MVALDLDSSQYFAANQTAAEVWEALADGATTDELVARLCERFEVGPEVARADVERLLGSLRSDGLIEPVAAKEQP